MMMKTIQYFPIFLIVACLCAWAGIAEAAEPLPTSPVAPDFFYQISSASGRVWIAPPTWKVMYDTAVPTSTDTTIRLSAARNEYEPIQIVARPSSNGTASVTMGSAWSGPSGDVIEETLHLVSYVYISTISGGVGGNTDQHGYPGYWPDPLYPIDFGYSATVYGGYNQPFWLTVYVPPTATAGTYSNTVTVTVNGTPYSIPIEVEVFDFEIPAEIQFQSYANFSWNNLGGGDSVERRDAIKRWWYEHRITPLGVVWPSGFRWNIVWDNGSKPVPCAPPVDESDSEPNLDYQAGVLANKYVAGDTDLLGSQFQGVGFPTFESMRFVNNSTPRPSTFCGQSIGGSHYGTSAYNSAWGAYLAALEDYFDPAGNSYGNDYLAKAHYYVMNEPQDAADYQLAAYLSWLTKYYAPNLKIMVSEEAKEEIYNNSTYPGYGYDIWLANLPAFNSAVDRAWYRLFNYNEQSWWYSLGHDVVPFINPIRINHPAIEPRLLTWLAWKYRVEGYAYYSWNNWSSDPWSDPDHVSTGENGEGFLFYPEPGTSQCTDKFIPSIRFELLRESFEDYEYFYQVNGNAKPVPYNTNAIDPVLDIIIPAMTGYNPDPAKLMWIRREIGRYLSGTVSSLPTEVASSPPRSYGAYHINFQDPAGAPYDNPLIVDGKTWMKVGWQPYDPTTQMGWFSDDMGLSDRLLTIYDDYEEGTVLQKSILVNNWGGREVFLFGVENGAYDVTIDVGRRGSSRANFVSVNGVPFVGDHNSGTPEWISGHITRTYPVEVRGGMLVLEIGRAHRDSDHSNEWTFISYLSIEPSKLPGTVTQTSPSGNITDTTPTYVWNEAEDATWYYLWVQGSYGPVVQEWYEGTAICTDGTCEVTPDTELGAGSYGWWVVPWNEYGYGAWSSGMIFTGTPPAAVTQVSPSGATTDCPPTFVWNTSTDAAWYQLWAGYVASGNYYEALQQWYEAESICSGGTCQVSVPMFDWSTNEWWVQPWSWYGSGEWSGMGFSLSDCCGTSVPSAVTLVSPSVTTDQCYPAFTWNEDPCASWYRLWVGSGSAPNYTTVIDQWYQAGVDVTCASGQCSVSADIPLADNSSYTWAVETWNAYGLGGWSNVETFTVDNACCAAPGTISQTEPTGQISACYPTFRWVDDPCVDWYRLWAGFNSSGTWWPDHDEWYEASAICSEGVCEVTPALFLNGAHSWWIQPWNEFGLGPWSAGSDFTLSGCCNAAAPGSVTAVAPSGSITESAPTYTWDEGCGAWYHLWVGDAGYQPMVDQWYQAVDMCSGGICTVRPDSPLTLGSYTWWMEPWNMYGYGPWNSGMSFTVESEPEAGSAAFMLQKRGTGRGTIRVDGQQCGPECPALLLPYIPDARVMVEVMPEADSSFVRWEDQDGNRIEYIYYIQPGEIVYAVFEKR